jgi:predicted transcriptional regulator
MADESLLSVLDVLLAKAEAPTVRPWTCKFAKWLETLTADEISRVNKIMESNITHAELHRLLSRVCDVSRDTIRTHRTGRCACRS